MGSSRLRKRARRTVPPAPAEADRASAPARVAPRASRATILALGAIPFAAILLLLAPYLWPFDQGPTSGLSDIHHYHAPMVQLLAAGLRRDGELPRWNTEDFAGMPVVGDPQAGLYNPVYWLLSLWPTVHGFGLLIVGYALAGAAGFLVYARTLGLSPVAASAGALAFVLGGKLLLQLVLPGHTVFAPFFLSPLVFYVAQRIADEPRPARVAGAAVLLGALAVSLHPQMLFYTALVLAIAATAMVRHATRPARALAALALAAALGVALAAVHWLPVLSFAGEFSRGQPDLFDAARWDGDTGLGIRWFGDVLSGRDAAPGAEINWESHYYLGGVTLALAAVGLLAWPRGDSHRRLVWLHGALALALLLFGLGTTGGIQPILAGLPGFALFRIPARAFILLGLPVALLVALGVEGLVRAPPRRRRPLACGAWILALVLLVVSGAAPVHFVTLALAALGAALLAGGEGLGRRTFAGALCLLVALAVDTGSVVRPYVQTAPEAEIGRLAPGLVLPRDLADAVRIAELERSAAEPGIPELTVRRLGLETLAGFNPLLPWRFVLYASFAGDINPFVHLFDIGMPILAAVPGLFDVMGVSHLLHPPGDEASAWRWERRTSAFPRAYLVPGPIVVPEGQGDELMAAEIDALGRLVDLDAHRQVLLHGQAAEAALAAIGVTAGTPLEPFRPVPLTRRTANRIALAVQVDRPGILVLNEPFFPGWRARDGASEIAVLRANVLFRALALAPGEHRIELEFSPTPWRIGWWVSAAALVVTLVLASAGVLRAGDGAGSHDGAHRHEAAETV